MNTVSEHDLQTIVNGFQIFIENGILLDDMLRCGGPDGCLMVVVQPRFEVPLPEFALRHLVRLQDLTAEESVW